MLKLGKIQRKSASDRQHTAIEMLYRWNWRARFKPTKNSQVQQMSATKKQSIVRRGGWIFLTGMLMRVPSAVKMLIMQMQKIAKVIQTIFLSFPNRVVNEPFSNPIRQQQLLG